MISLFLFHFSNSGIITLLATLSRDFNNKYFYHTMRTNLTKKSYENEYYRNGIARKKSYFLLTCLNEDKPGFLMVKIGDVNHIIKTLVVSRIFPRPFIARKKYHETRKMARRFTRQLIIKGKFRVESKNNHICSR